MYVCYRDFSFPMCLITCSNYKCTTQINIKFHFLASKFQFSRERTWAWNKHTDCKLNLYIIKVYKYT